MTRPPVRCDEGGEAPCFAHLLDGSWEIPDAQVDDPTGTPDPPLDDPTEPPDRELDGPAAVNRDVTERVPDALGVSPQARVGMGARAGGG